MKFPVKLFLVLLLQEVLFRRTDVKRVILAPKATSPEDGWLMKKLSAEDIASVFVRRENLGNYIGSDDFKLLPWTAVVLKERDLKSANYLTDSSIVPSFFWLLLDASNSTLREELVGFYIPINTALLLIEKLGPDYYVLSEYYKIKKSGQGIFQTFAEWKNNDLKIVKTEWYDRKSNFQGYKLNTVKFSEDLYLTPKEKINEAIWNELSVLLNFTTNEKLVEYSPKSESVELSKDEEEALLDSTIYIGDSQKFRYLLGPTSQSRMYMHVKAEGENKGLVRFLMPFAKDTWWGLGAWMCCCAIFSVVVEYFSRKFKINEKPSEGLYATAFIPLDILCNQSGARPKKNLTSRLMLFLFHSSSGVISRAYGATFISYLLLYIPQLPFTNLKGFVEDGTYKIIGERNSDVDKYFNVSIVPLEKLVYSKFLVDVAKWERLDREIDKICAGERLVLVAYDNDVDKYQPCHIVKIKKPLKVVANGFKIKFKSPYRGLLHVKLLLLRSTGVLKKLNHQIPGKVLRNHHYTNHGKVSIERVTPSFILLFYGYFFSVVILVVEIRNKKFKSDHNTHGTGPRFLQ